MPWIISLPPSWVEGIVIDDAPRRIRISRGSLLTGSVVLTGSAVFALFTSGLHAQGIAVRDSARIRIFSNVRSSWKGISELFHVDTVSTVVLGGRAGPGSQKIGRVSGAARLIDGGVVVADGEQNQLAFFDSSGHLKFHIGGRGDRPGEFASLWNLLHWGSSRDTIAAWDGTADRLTAFDGKGRVLQWDRISNPPDIKRSDGSTRAALILLGRFPTGERLGRVRDVHGMASQGVEADSTPVVLISRSGTLSEIGRILSSERFRYRGTKYGARGDVPFGRTGSVAVLANDWYYTDGANYEIERRDRTGRLAALIRVDRPMAAVTPDDIVRLQAVRLPRTDSVLRPELAQALAWMPYPKVRPAYTALLADRTGKLWARTWSSDGDPTWWDIFDRTGRFLGGGWIPADLDVIEVGSGYLLARFERSSGTEIRVYQLRR
jgi:hypothetical protein